MKARLKEPLTSSASQPSLPVPGSQLLALPAPTSSQTTTTTVPLSQSTDQISEQAQSELSEKQRIELEWDINRLTLLRRAIFENFVKSSIFKDYLLKLKTSKTPSTGSQSSNNTSSGVYGYLSWRLFNYFKRSPANDQTKLDPQQEQQKHNQIDEEVLALINDSAENDSLLRRDSLLASLEFKLNTASIKLGEIAEFKFEKSTVLLEALPRHDSLYFQLNLGSFFLYDSHALNSSDQSHFSTIICPLSKQPTEFVFQLVYEHNPFPANNNKQQNDNSSLTIKSCGLDIVYNLDFLQRLKKFFEAASMHYQKTVFQNQTKSSRVRKKANFYSPIINKIKFDFEIAAPRVVFPQDFNSHNSLVVIFDFGRLAFLNRVKRASTNTTNEQAKNKIVILSFFF